MNTLLSSDELLLRGHWIATSDGVVSDETNKRIEWLISSQLVFISNNPILGDWEVLYQDPHDERYWELTYPESELQGGGPLQLQNVAPNAIKAKYNLNLPQALP